MNSENIIIEQALKILASRLRKTSVSISSPTALKQYLQHRLISEEREIFGTIWLDVKNRMVSSEDMALGTLTHTSVYPREVVKAALRNNAAGVIFFHNHPSGDTKPSSADHQLTRILKDAMKLIDVRVLDHIIVAGEDTYSFAEHGDL